MQETSFKTRKWVPWVVSAAAILIALVLSVAAVGKFFAPAPAFRHLDRTISVFEVVLAACFLFWRQSMGMWLSASALFSLWGGYAYFWYSVQLPCGCMGAKLALPSLFSLLFDGFFLLFGLGAAYFLGARPKALFSTVVAATLLATGGFFTAQNVFQKILLS